MLRLLHTLCWEIWKTLYLTSDFDKLRTKFARRLVHRPTFFHKLLQLANSMFLKCFVLFCFDIFYCTTEDWFTYLWLVSLMRFENEYKVLGPRVVMVSWTNPRVARVSSRVNVGFFKLVYLEVERLYLNFRTVSISLCQRKNVVVISFAQKVREWSFIIGESCKKLQLEKPAVFQVIFRPEFIWWIDPCWGYSR